MTTALIIVNVITLCVCIYTSIKAAQKSKTKFLSEEVDYLHGTLQGFSDYSLEQFGKIEEELTNLRFTTALTAATLPAGAKNTPAKKIAAKKAVAKKSPTKKPASN